jgi:hypothetical protein
MVKSQNSLKVILLKIMPVILMLVGALAGASYYSYQQGYASGKIQGKLAANYEYLDCYDAVGRDHNILIEYLMFISQIDASSRKPEIYQMFMAWNREKCMESKW